MDKHAQYKPYVQYTQSGALNTSWYASPRVKSYTWLWIGLIVCTGLVIGALLYFGVI